MVPIKDESGRVIFRASDTGYGSGLPRRAGGGENVSSLVDPLEIAERVKQVVSSGEKREYYRFRPAPFYGGIATANCAGCYLRCLYCWSWNIIIQPEKVGRS